jgi:hypothetical protein
LGQQQKQNGVCLFATGVAGLIGMIADASSGSSGSIAIKAFDVPSRVERCIVASFGKA